ncbi:cation diffusion facilitator family transporter [Flavobacterium sp. '19STA2R22 D10 B1']|uniref:cation diffusion facilitator family transporter n=1 Tax=Flavobacterium aerium TaxID=3037261 RepID=UPI00278C190A|nr:cation diffusion facilitator family transporter [Flavobacterium sp. '19STA2R22 D10 B1']
MKEKNTVVEVNKGLRTTLIGIIVSAILAVIKALGGIFGNSYALIADAIESGADVLTSTMLWFGLKWSLKPADEDHPYGHGKVEALVALGIALAMVLAAFVITHDSIHNIMVPHEAPAPYTLLILVGVILTKEILYRYVLKTGEEMKSNAVKADAFHHRSDAITSAAAFIGITIGIIGGKGYEVADDYAALFAAVLIVYNAYIIARPAIGELLDEALEPELLEDIKIIAGKVIGVEVVEKAQFRKMGTAYQVDMHIWVDKDLSVEKGHEISHMVKDAVLEQVPQVMNVHIHIEPYYGKNTICDMH